MCNGVSSFIHFFQGVIHWIAKGTILGGAFEGFSEV